MAKKKKNKETVFEDRVIRCRVKIDRQFYPKSPATINDGDFGIVTAHVIWKDSSEKYVAPILHPTFKTITIKGDSLPHIKIDGRTEYTLQAYETESDYGTSYTVKMMGEVVDLSHPDKQRAFLRQILTERQVETLFETFIDPIQAIKEGTKEELKQMKGFGDKAVERLMMKVLSTEDMSEVLIELEAYKLTKRELDGLMVKYKNPRLIVDLVKKNPYIVMDAVNRVGFIRADEIALNGNFDRRSSKRVAAYIRYWLEDQAEKGNSWVYTNLLVQAIDDYFSKDHISDEAISRALKSLIKDKYLWHSEDKQRVGLKYIFDIEQGIAKEMRRLLSFKNKFKYESWESKVKEQEYTQGWKYTDEQYQGIKTVLDHNVVLVQGLAGTGKSSIISGMLCAYDEEYKVATTALSGRAAVNITETARKNGMEVDGKTIHRLLKVAGEEGEFLHNENNPLEEDIIILDEVSMVNIELMYSLLKSIKKGAKIIMLGDSGQLPSVGAGNFMTDILNADLIPTVTLTKVHRQAEASGIISESVKIRKGIAPCKSNDCFIEVRGELQDCVMDLHTDSSETFNRVVDWFKVEWEKLDNILDILVVVPMRERGSTSAYHINNAIQSYLFERTLKAPYIVNQGQKNEFKLYVGDKIVNNKNDYEVISTNGGETAIYNGNVGIILDIDFQNHIITADFGDVGVVLLEPRHIKNLTLGYAMTIHKCVTGDTLIYTNQGIKKLKELDNGAKVGELKPFTNNDVKVYNGKYLEAPSGFYNAGFGETRIITTQTGYSIEGTLDHRGYVINEQGALEIKFFKDMAEGDLLLINTSNGVFGDSLELPKEWLNREDYKRAKEYQLPKRMTEDLALFLGLMVADGVISRGGIAFAKRNKEVVEVFRGLLKSLFNYEATIKEFESVSKKDKTGFYKIEVSSVVIRDFCKKIEGIQPNNKFVPNAILKAPKNIQTSFLKGVFEDGSVNVKNGKFEHIEISMKEDQMKKQIQVMLLNLGIESSCNSYKGLPRVTIYPKGAFVYEKEIGFISKDKQLKLLEVLKSPLQSKANIPNARLLLNQLCEENKLRENKKLPAKVSKEIAKRGERPHMTQSMLKHTLDLVDGLIEVNESLYNYLKWLANDVKVDKIKTIEKSENQTYCLEMPETHTFIQNGLLMLNCQGSGIKTVICVANYESYVMLSQELIYTAITRAKERCIVVAESSALRFASSRSSLQNKQTFLPELLLN